MSSQALPAQELMDRVYRHQRHIYDATRKYFLLGRDHLIARLDPPAGGHVLELGCGTGRNLIAAARRYPRARFHGVDISSAMLATARKNIAGFVFDGRISLAQADAACIDPSMFGLERFERVFFSYSLSMIPAWREALAHGAALLAPGGRLSLVDFGPTGRAAALVPTPAVCLAAKISCESAGGSRRRRSTDRRGSRRAVQLCGPLPRLRLLRRDQLPLTSAERSGAFSPRWRASKSSDGGSAPVRIERQACA